MFLILEIKSAGEYRSFITHSIYGYRKSDSYICAWF